MQKSSIEIVLYGIKITVDDFCMVDIEMVPTIMGSIIEGSLEVKLPTIWTDEKQSWAEAERRGE